MSDAKCQAHTLISSPSNKRLINSWTGKVIRRCAWQQHYNLSSLLNERINTTQPRGKTIYMLRAVSQRWADSQSTEKYVHSRTQKHAQRKLQVQTRPALMGVHSCVLLRPTNFRDTSRGFMGPWLHLSPAAAAVLPLTPSEWTHKLFFHVLSQHPSQNNLNIFKSTGSCFVFFTDLKQKSENVAVKALYDLKMNKYKS